MMRSWCLCLVAVSCAACNDEAPRGGLVLMVVQDGSLEPDSLRLAYAAPEQPANEARWAIPREAELPLTITLEAKQGSASQVTIDASLWSDDSRLDRRSVTVSNIPKHRYAAVELLFGARCSPTLPWARDCSGGQTCDPHSGMCVSQDIDAAKLPDYEPGLETTITWDPPGSPDAGNTSSGEAGASRSSNASEAGASSTAAPTRPASGSDSNLDGGIESATSLESSSESSRTVDSTGASSTGASSTGTGGVVTDASAGLVSRETTAPEATTPPPSSSPERSTADSEPDPLDTSSASGSDTATTLCTGDNYSHGGECTPWDTCMAGFYVLVEGTAEANRICEGCPPDSFSAGDNWPACSPFTHCGFRAQTSDGSSSEDVTCAEGDVVFQFGSEDGDTASAVAVDGDGSVYVVGYTDGDTFGVNAGSWDAFIQKRTATGTVAWSKQFGTSNYDRAQGLVVNANGDVTVVGSTEGNLARTPGLADLFLRRYKANGDVVWTTQYGTPNLDMAYSVVETATGSLVVTGRTYGTFSGNNPDGADFFVSSFSAEGAHEWSQQIGSNEADFRGWAIAVNTSGNIVAVGNTVAGFGGDDATMLELTADGVISWQKSFGSNAQDVPMAVVTDADDNIYVAGYTYGKLGANDLPSVDAWVSKRDPEGALLWIDQFGTSAEDAALAIALRGSSLYVAGQWGNESNLADDQVFVRRYNLDGTGAVNHVFGTSQPEYGYGLAVAADRIFVCGDTSGDFGATNAGRYDAFLTQVVLP